MLVADVFATFGDLEFVQLSFTEPVETLAHLARFVYIGLTAPREKNGYLAQIETGRLDGSVVKTLDSPVPSEQLIDALPRPRAPVGTSVGLNLARVRCRLVGDQRLRLGEQTASASEGDERNSRELDGVVFAARNVVGRRWGTLL